MFPTLKTNLAQMSTFLVCMVLGTSAFGQSDDVDPAFFASLAKTKSHADAALIGERFGFAQETDPNRSTFFQNEKADAHTSTLAQFYSLSLRVLSPRHVRTSLRYCSKAGRCEPIFP